jgi:hypothetical protein
MNVAYWFLLAPIVALDGYVSMKELQKWFPYVWESHIARTCRTLTTR